MKKITLIIIWMFSIHLANAQDNCAGAVPINAAGNYVVGVMNGTPPTLFCAPNGAIPTANVPGAEWYVYTPTQNYTVTLTTDIAANNPRKDTRVHVYTGTCAALVCYANDDDTGSGYSSICTFNVTAGTPYYIAWDNRWLGTSANTGFTFQLIQSPVVVPPPTPITYNSVTVSTINSSYNIGVVDMNGDHKDDIVGVSANNLKVHFQSTPSNYTISNFPITGTSDMPTWSLAAGDYNKDGFNDLLLGSGSGLTFWRSNNTGTAYTNVNPTDYIFCQRTNFIDINNDGHLDAFSCHDVNPNVYYMNDGAGNFTYYQSGVTPGAYNLGVLSTGGNYASLWSDFDNDGDRDMFISKCSGPPCEMHRNNGNGTFTDISAISGLNVTPVQSWSSAIADFDNDGDMDILIGSNGSTRSMLFRNNLDVGNPAFTNISTGSGWDTNTSINRDYVAYDFDNNGYVDVLGSGNKIMFNQGNNVFAAVSYAAISVGAIGDLNNDGFLDIQNGTTVRYAVPNGNNWLKVALNGVQSNSNGIGARIEIYGAFGKQIRDIRSGEGFAYMSSLNAHFGIGLATAITQVVIKWPSGVVDTVYNPAINQQLLVTEGETSSVVNLRLFTQGYYDSAQSMRPVKNLQDGVSPLTDVENITVELRNANAPYGIVSTVTTMLKTNGTAVCRFPPVTPGSYYLAVKTRNSLETWSSSPQPIGNAPLNYDFTTAVGKAYGDNMVQLESGVFGLYSGDIPDGGIQDGMIDSSDYSKWEADNNNFAFGVFATDLNGDGIVDSADYSIWEENNNNFIFSSHP